MATTVREFLEALFSPDLGGSYIEVRRIKPGHTLPPSFHESAAQLADAMPKDLAEQDGFNVYFGVCLRSRREGTKDAVKFVGCLWVDLDAKHFGGGKSEAFQRLLEFALPPTGIVRSGHGFHGYWVLKEPQEITGPTDITRIEAILKALAAALGGDRQSAELARLLRLPGTYNVKDTSAPVLATIEVLIPERQYNLSDFESLLAVGPSEQIEQANPSGWIAKALADLHEGNRNATFAKLAGKLHRDAWPPDSILALLLPHAKHCGFPSEELRHEIDGLCRRYPSRSSSGNSEETETESRPLELISLAGLLASSSTEIAWRIEGLLPQEGVGILAGPAGYGKSWMLLDLAIECARGGKWLGQFQTTAGRVLYLDRESSVNLLGCRLPKLLAAKRLTSDALDLSFVVGQPFSFSRRESVEALRHLLAQYRPALVIVDSLIRVHGADENSASEMARVFEIVKELVREFNCAMLFADHQRKPGQFSVSADQLLRGSTEKAAFVDTLLSLKKQDEHLVVEHSKSRFAEPVAAFLVGIHDPQPGQTIVRYAGEAEAVKEAARLEAAHAFLVSALSEEMWTSRKELVEQAKAAGVSEKALDEALKAGRFERENRKADSGRGGKAAFYRRKTYATASLFPSHGPETETEYLGGSDGNAEAD